MKKCNKCGELKPLIEFRRCIANKDGTTGDCAECIRQHDRGRYKKNAQNPEWVKETNKRHRDCRAVNPDRHRAWEKTYRLKHPEKTKAKSIRDNNLCRERVLANRAAVTLSETGLYMHHWNYNEEYRLDVIKLTPSEHARVHNHITRDGLIYRRNDNNDILNTKAIHEEYVAHILNVIYAD